MERNVPCKAIKNKQTREQNPVHNETNFRRSSKIHQAILQKESAVRINKARKRHPNERSKKNLDVLYDLLVPGPAVQKTDEYTSVIREPGKIDVSIRICDIAKFGK